MKSANNVTMLGNMSLRELQENLTVLSLRAQSLCGRSADGKPIGAATAAHINAILAELADPAKVTANEKALLDAQQDPKMRAQLCGVRVQTFNNYLLPQANFLNFFFEVIDLGANEDRPYHQNTTMNEVSLYSIAGNNRPKQVKVGKDDVETAIDLGYIATDKVRFRKNDIYKGDIVQTALATLLLANDMALKIDKQAFTLLNANAFGAFTLTGKKQLRSFNLNSHIDPDNLPTTNDIRVYKDSAGVGNIDEDGTAVERFGFETLDAICDYANRFNGLFPDGSSLIPTGRILMNPKDIKQIAGNITKTGAAATEIAKELMARGWGGVGYNNKNWVFVPDPRLDPADGYAYPEFNKKAGQAFFKSSQDKEYSSAGDYEYESQNEEERWMKKVFGAAFNSATRLFVARFKYKA